MASQSQHSPARVGIVLSAAAWSAFSSTRSSCPVKAAKQIYPALSDIQFAQVLDCSKGRIEQPEFDRWHSASCALLRKSVGCRFSLGWAAKIINVYLKIACGVGSLGRPNIRHCIHPPMDRQLLKAIKKKGKLFHLELKDVNKIQGLKHITTKQDYESLICYVRQLAKVMHCSAAEIEQLWVPSEYYNSMPLSNC